MTTQPAVPGPPMRGRGQPRKYPPDAVVRTVRIPPDVAADIERAARDAGHSMNDEIVARCRRANS